MQSMQRSCDGNREKILTILATYIIDSGVCSWVKQLSRIYMVSMLNLQSTAKYRLTTGWFIFNAIPGNGGGGRVIN